MRSGVVVHQEEPRSHCITVGSDKFKDFILIYRGLCVLLGICLPRPPLAPPTNWPCWMILLGSMTFSTASSDFTMSWSTGHQWRTLPILVVYGQMPIKLYGAGQWAQGLLQDTGPSVHPFVGLWQCLSCSSRIKEQILTLLRVRGTLVRYNPD